MDNSLTAWADFAPFLLDVQNWWTAEQSVHTRRRKLAKPCRLPSSSWRSILPADKRKNMKKLKKLMELALLWNCAIYIFQHDCCIVLSRSVLIFFLSFLLSYRAGQHIAEIKFRTCISQKKFMKNTPFTLVH